MKTKNYKKSSYKTVPQKKKIDKNQLYAYILAVMMVFWTIASIFAFVGYARTKKASAHSRMITASAQTIEEYNQNTYVVEMPHLSGLIYSYQTLGGTVTKSFSDYELLLTTNMMVLQAYNLIPVEETSRAYFRGVEIENVLYRNGMYFDIVYSNAQDEDTTSEGTNFFQRWDSMFYDVDIQFLNTNGNYYQLQIIYDFHFVLGNDTYSYTFSLVESTPVACSSASVYVPYTDTIRNREQVYQSLGNPCMGFPTADFIKYYNITSTLDPDAVLSYELGYSTGYSVGYKEGQDVGIEVGNQTGFNNGYAEGRVIGYNEGYDIGYNDGANNANTYTFDKLLSAVFDVPVRTFTSLFDFEILGVDMAQFFLSLLTLAIALAVVRLLL